MLALRILCELVKRVLSFEALGLIEGTVSVSVVHVWIDKVIMHISLFCPRHALECMGLRRAFEN